MAKIKVIVNGKEREIEENLSINGLLSELEVKSPMLVVERNLQIVPKDNYSDIIATGDKFEIVGFFGGG